MEQFNFDKAVDIYMRQNEEQAYYCVNSLLYSACLIPSLFKYYNHCLMSFCL